MVQYYSAINDIFNLQHEYVADHEKNKMKNRFDVTSTPVYAHLKDHDDQTSDVSYFTILSWESCKRHKLFYRNIIRVFA